jgi:DNA-binding NarL/FixJ family response regulator
VPGGTPSVRPVAVASRAGLPATMTFSDHDPGSTLRTVVHGLVAGVGGTGQPAMGAPMRSVTHRTGAPPASTACCDGTGLTFPPCVHMMIALAVSSGGKKISVVARGHGDRKMTHDGSLGTSNVGSWVLASTASVYVIDPDGIYRLGISACLAAVTEVGQVDGSESYELAREQPALALADLAIVSVDLGDTAAIFGHLHLSVGCPVLATAHHLQADAVMQALDAGAIGVVSKSGLTSAGLAAQVRAALLGAGVVPPELLSSFTTVGRGRAALRQSGGLTNREQSVLRLFADGKLTREVARELSYSERTVKSVLREAVTKLGARSRSQAIAHAVREGFI